MRQRKKQKYEFLWFCLAIFLHIGCDVENLPEQASSGQLIDGLRAKISGNNSTEAMAAANGGNNLAVMPAANQATAGMQAPGVPGMPTITIASFNIQVFGTTKANDRWVLERLAVAVRAFDVVAIQEIRTTDQTVMERFIQAINADGSQYSYVIGPRLGRTNSKEQYVFVYNTRKIVCSKENAYTVNDPDGLLHRPPLVAHFQVLGVGNLQPFSFTLINIHTDPDEISTELDVLANVIKNCRPYEFPEDDIILLGDLNCGPKDFKALGQIPGIFPLIQNVATNTRQNKLYDNIVIDQYATQEFTGKSGVWNLQEYYRLTVDDALRLSDHFPVWAEFSAFEMNPQAPAMATQPGNAAGPANTVR